MGINLGLAVSFRIPLAASGPVGPPQPIFLTRDHSTFSPNGDGIKDVITFTPRTAGFVEKCGLLMKNRENQTVKVFHGEDALPPIIVWDGRTDGGNLAADGKYTVEEPQG